MKPDDLSDLVFAAFIEAAERARAEPAESVLQACESQRNVMRQHGRTYLHLVESIPNGDR